MPGHPHHPAARGQAVQVRPGRLHPAENGPPLCVGLSTFRPRRRSPMNRDAVGERVVNPHGVSDRGTQPSDRLWDSIREQAKSRRALTTAYPPPLFRPLGTATVDRPWTTRSASTWRPRSATNRNIVANLSGDQGGLRVHRSDGRQYASVPSTLKCRVSGRRRVSRKARSRSRTGVRRADRNAARGAPATTRRARPQAPPASLAHLDLCPIGLRRAASRGDACGHADATFEG